MVRDERPAALLLRRMLETYSPTGAEDAMARLLVEEARAMGMEVSIDEAGNLVASSGGAGNTCTTVALVGHMDTVKGRLDVSLIDEDDDTVLTGRGAVDAKGPLAAMLVAASTFTGSKDVKVIVVGCTDEEGGSRGAKHLARSMVPGPDAIIVGEPSGWDAVTIGYKGTVKCMFTCCRDEAHRACGPKGTDKGDGTGAEIAVAFWAAVQALCERNTVKGTFESLTATLVSINSSTDGIQGTGTAEVDIRLPPKMEPTTIEVALQGIAKGLCGDITILDTEHPVVVDKNNGTVRALIKAVREAGGTPSYKKKTGTSDMNLLARAWPGVPIATYGPGDSSLDHTPGERISIRELERSIEVLRSAIATIAAGTTSRPPP